MATDPKFASTARAAQVQVSVANTARDGTGTLGTLITGVAAGTKIFEIVVEATVTTTAGMVRLFLSLDAGVTKRMIDEFPVSAITVSASVAAFRTARKYDNLILPDASATLYTSTHIGEAINTFAFGADLT